MRNKKAKELRKLFKNREPWLEYKPTEYHKIKLVQRINSNEMVREAIIVNPITMTDTCGRKLYKGIKKAQYV